MTDYSTWIREENLRPAVEALASICGYNFDESDWAAIRHGVKDTDEAEGVGFDYPLIGVFRIDMSISLDVGTSNCSLKVTSKRDILEQTWIIEFFSQSFSIRRL